MIILPRKGIANICIMVKLLILQTIFYISVHFNFVNQGRRMLCNSEGAQGPGMRTIGHLGGSGGMLPQENFELLTPKECF